MLSLTINKYSIIVFVMCSFGTFLERQVIRVSEI
jgi:hypothetical protein